MRVCEKDCAQRGLGQLDGPANCGKKGEASRAESREHREIRPVVQAGFVHSLSFLELSQVAFGPIEER